MAEKIPPRLQLNACFFLSSLTIYPYSRMGKWREEDARLFSVRTGFIGRVCRNREGFFFSLSLSTLSIANRILEN